MSNKKMTKNIQRYLVSAGGGSDDDYGIYVMDHESDQHLEDMLLVYHYDSDRFTHIRDKHKAHFVPPAELTSCKDEFGNEFTGSQLMALIHEAIGAYEEELPGFVNCQF